MKIVFSTDQIYLHGGIEKVISSKANYFADYLDYEVYIVTSEQKGFEPIYKLSPKIKKVDLEINYYRKLSYFNFRNFSKIPTHFFKWKKAISIINPDVIITCNDSFDFYWMPFFFKKIKKIREFHSSRFFKDKQKNNLPIFKKIILKINDYIESKYDRIIILNRDEKQFYHSTNTVVIPNAIPLSEIKSKLTPFKAIAAGRIAAVKNFEDLIKIWKLVVEKDKKSILDIYGNGELEYVETLNKLIIDLNLENNVFIKQATSNLFLTMADYSLFLMTSHSECFPMVLLESLSVGLPIVSFDCPFGPRNIITEDEDGFLIENKNLEKFADKVIELFQNPEYIKELGNNAKKNIEKYSEKEIFENYILVLTCLVNNRN
jgi:glycosyltransferase involved in cell wall biosynthesis